MNSYLHLMDHFHFVFYRDRLTVALAALGLTIAIGLITGPWANNASPLYWGFLDRIFGGFGRRLDKRQRKPADLILRGFFLTVPVCILSYEIGVTANLAAGLNRLYMLPEILCLSVLVTSGAVWFSLLRLFRALKMKGASVKGAYYTISRSARHDLSGSDDYGITRSGMALAARAFDKGMVAPLFWYVLAGLPAAFIYAGLAAMSWRFGRDGFTRGFGRVPMGLEKLMGFVPNVIAGFLIVLAGIFTPTGGITRGFAGILGRAGNVRYEEGGLPVTAMAHALHVGLGGPAIDLEGSALQRQWAGPENATAQLDGAHLKRALYIIVVAHLLLALTLGVILLCAYHRLSDFQ